MTTPLGAAIFLRSYPLEATQPIALSNQGLEYLGEAVLQDKVNRRLEGLLKIVQASDLSALSNTLNHEQMLFIPQILKGP